MSDAIHFLNTGHSDCIILESGGHFAMIDAAEDTDYPADKPWLNLPGYEDEVCDYLLRNCADDRATVHFDFVLATHAHSDHMGGFDTVINHPAVKIKKAFLKPYHDKNVFIMERKMWDNVRVYEQMKNALEAKNVPIVEKFDSQKFRLGNFDITFFNGTYKKPMLKFGENVHSVATLVECNDFRALLAGDMNYKNGGERRIASAVGKINLLKVGHHGYAGSTSIGWLKKLMPEYAVVCNSSKAAGRGVVSRLSNISKSQILYTVDSDGIKVVLDNGISILENAMQV